jgi:hypothetical protein
MNYDGQQFSFITTFFSDTADTLKTKVGDVVGCIFEVECSVGGFLILKQIIVYLTSLCVNWAFFGISGPKKAQFTHERVEYNVFLFDESLIGSKSLKIFKISLTFRFNKL